MIYLDNAATGGKKPPIVIENFKKALTDYCVNPGRSGHSLSLKAAEEIYKTRSKTADFFHSEKPDNVIFTMNCTQSINYVLKGCLNKGDHLIISNLEHNSVARTAFALKQKGVEVTVFDAFSEDITEELQRCRKKNTKMVCCLHVSNVCGKILPIGTIGQFCKKHNILFAVDGAQSGGIEEINMKEMGIDYLCLAPHKGLFSPMGIGVLIAEKPINNTFIEGGTGSGSLDLTMPTLLPERMESGTMNLPAVLAFSKGLDFIKNVGMENIRRHENELVDLFKNRLKNNQKIKIYSYEAPVVSLVIKDRSSEEIGEFLNKKGIAVRSGLHCAPFAHKTLGTLPDGTVRISVGYFNKREEILYTCKVIDRLTKNL